MDLCEEYARYAFVDFVACSCHNQSCSNDVVFLCGRPRVILNAKWDALCGIPAMWRKRRVIQRKRIAWIGEIWRMLDKSLFPRLSQFLQRYS